MLNWFDADNPPLPKTSTRSYCLLMRYTRCRLPSVGGLENIGMVRDVARILRLGLKPICFHSLSRPFLIIPLSPIFFSFLNPSHTNFSPSLTSICPVLPLLIPIPFYRGFGCKTPEKNLNLQMHVLEFLAPSGHCICYPKALKFRWTSYRFNLSMSAEVKQDWIDYICSECSTNVAKVGLAFSLSHAHQVFPLPGDFCDFKYMWHVVAISIHNLEQSFESEPSTKSSCRWNEHVFSPKSRQYKKKINWI